MKLKLLILVQIIHEFYYLLVGVFVSPSARTRFSLGFSPSIASYPLPRLLLPSGAASVRAT